MRHFDVRSRLDTRPLVNKCTGRIQVGKIWDDQNVSGLCVRPLVILVALGLTICCATNSVLWVELLMRLQLAIEVVFDFPALELLAWFLWRVGDVMGYSGRY